VVLEKIDVAVMLANEQKLGKKAKAEFGAGPALE
jgi:hypothetical protein